MTNPCTTCPDALQDGFCSRYDSRMECRAYREHTRNRRLERIFTMQAVAVQIKVERERREVKA